MNCHQPQVQNLTQNTPDNHVRGAILKAFHVTSPKAQNHSGANKCTGITCHR